MALAQAQHLVKKLGDTFEENGAKVRFAIHPVAGRMPGHMNVLLAEADVPYDELYQMEDINDDFQNTDLVVVVGANDVINPAANTAEGTPIYGMPILNVDKAKYVLILNYDLKPGYAGVDNPLYTEDKKVQLLLGDASKTLPNVIEIFSKQSTPTKSTKKESASYIDIINKAQNAIIVPGYGMALAQAQHLVKQLADKLESKGIKVRYAIHPVAGRMPGHMNVLLAEVDIPYEKLKEMDEVNPEFIETDVAIVIGACDVVNPAAISAEGTPIYGMPILRVDEAKNVIVCNLDTKPGYSGVENPLYQQPNVLLLLGNATETIEQLADGLESSRS
jgi:NAD(P) transhydrogenase subunit beta